MSARGIFGLLPGVVSFSVPFLPLRQTASSNVSMPSA
jgi:hypothetical protein